MDVITDGEIRRESYSNRFATALDGVDLDEPGRRARPDRPREPGPAGRRAGAAHAARSRSATSSSSARHGPPDQDHRPGTVHDDAAGAERPLRRRPRASRSPTPRRSTRSCATSRVPAPTSSRSTSRTSRPGPSGTRVRGRGDQRALEGIEGDDRAPHLLRLRAHRPRPAAAAIRFWRSSQTAAPTHVSLEAAQPELGPAARGAARQDDRARCARPGDGRGRDGRGRRGPAPRGARSACPPERLVAAPDCGMKYLPRERAFAQARGDGRGCAARLGRAERDAAADRSARAVSWRVPPRHYGPWEQFASLLTEGLVARGVDVTLFATADSITSAGSRR